MKEKISMLVLLLLGLSSSRIHAQTTFNASSNIATIDGITYEYSIGEMSLVSTEQNSTLIITQGFLQPNGIGSFANESSDASALSDLSSHIKIYPNPTNHEIFIESMETKTGDVMIQLFDASGKIVLSKNEQQTIGNNTFKIEVNTFAAGNYFLMLTKPNQTGILEKFSYKIQKTN